MIAADIPSWISAVAAVVLVAVTVVLVRSTAGLKRTTDSLVDATKDLVTESAEARLMSVRPALSIDLWWFGNYAFVDLYSIGLGAAINVDVTLEWHATDSAGTALLGDRWRSWTTNCLPSGARHRFNPPTSRNGGLMIASELAMHVTKITLDGTMQDVLGNSYPVHSEVSAMELTVENEALSQRQLVPAEPLERIAYRSDQLEKIADHLQVIRDALRTP